MASGPLSRGVLQTLRAHLPASAVRDTWLRRLREDEGALRRLVSRLSGASPGDPSAVAFAQDPVGSHLFRTAIERSAPRARSALLAVLAPAAEALARSTHGSFVLRAALELAPSAAHTSALLTPLLPRVAELARCVSGAHVIQVALGCASERERGEIVERLLAGPPAGAPPRAREPALPAGGRGALLSALAADAHGSLVAQAVLQLGSGAQRALAQRALLGRARELAQSAPGSFVVGTALRVASADEAAAWLAQLLPHAAELAGSRAGVRALHACAEVSAEADRAVAAATGLLAHAQLEADIRRLSAGGRTGAAEGGAAQTGAGERAHGAAAASARRAAAGGGEGRRCAREPPLLIGSAERDGSCSAEGDVLEFPPGALDAHSRRRAHELAKALGLSSESVGQGDGRRLIVRRPSPETPSAAAQAFVRRASPS